MFAVIARSFPKKIRNQISAEKIKATGFSRGLADDLLVVFTIAIIKEATGS
jgi:hypothetical protein